MGRVETLILGVMWYGLFSLPFVMLTVQANMTRGIFVGNGVNPGFTYIAVWWLLYNLGWGMALLEWLSSKGRNKAATRLENDHRAPKGRKGVML